MLALEEVLSLEIKNMKMRRLKIEKIKINFLFGFLCLFVSSFAVATEITLIEIKGNKTTRAGIIEDLLPRSLPTDLSESEITEFTRRVKNLGIFDSVQVDVVGNKVVVDLRKKGTITPIVGLSTGKTIEDSSITGGFQDYDFNGDGTRAGGKISYVERGLNFAAWIDEHNYSPNRWANEYELYRLSSGFRFDNTDEKWTRNRLGGFAEWVSPFNYGSHILHEFQLMTYYENNTNKVGQIDLNDGMYIGGLYEFVYDKYKWDDLTPSGYKFVLEFRPGMMTTGKIRSETRFKFLAAFPVWDQSAIVLNGNFAAVNPGDVNHSLLIGSQQGVRGLRDSFYRTAFANYINAEIRHAFRVGSRLFLQPIAFVDGAVFKSMSASGSLSPWTEALSAGSGLRLVPTAFTNLLFRGDVARSFVPTPGWSFLFGITQYL